MSKTQVFPVEEKISLSGRPSKYSERGVVGKIKKYIRSCIDKRKTPYGEEFALKLGVSYRTLCNWAEDEDKKKFGEWFEILKTIQRLDLKRKSLTGEYVSPIAKILLSAEHDVTEKIKEEVSGKDGKPVEIEQKMSPEDRKAYAATITKIFDKIYSKAEPHG